MSDLRRYSKGSDFTLFLSSHFSFYKNTSLASSFLQREITFLFSIFGHRIPSSSIQSMASCGKKKIISLPLAYPNRDRRLVISSLLPRDEWPSHQCYRLHPELLRFLQIEAEPSLLVALKPLRQSKPHIVGSQGVTFLIEATSTLKACCVSFKVSINSLTDYLVFKYFNFGLNWNYNG